MNEALDQKFIRIFAPKASGGQFMGRRLDDMSREELMAVIGYFGQAAALTHQQHQRDMDNLCGRPS